MVHTTSPFTWNILLIITIFLWLQLFIIIYLLVNYWRAFERSIPACTASDSLIRVCGLQQNLLKRCSDICFCLGSTAKYHLNFANFHPSIHWQHPLHPLVMFRALLLSFLLFSVRLEVQLDIGCLTIISVCLLSSSSSSGGGGRGHPGQTITTTIITNRIRTTQTTGSIHADRMEMIPKKVLKYWHRLKQLHSLIPH